MEKPDYPQLLAEFYDMVDKAGNDHSEWSPNASFALELFVRFLERKQLETE